MNKERYIDQYKLLDDTYNPNQIFITSTSILRTIQSSYSEMMGLYQPKKTTQMTEGEKNSLKSGKGMPKLKIRNLGSDSDS